MKFDFLTFVQKPHFICKRVNGLTPLAENIKYVYLHSYVGIGKALSLKSPTLNYNMFLFHNCVDNEKPPCD